VEQKWLRTLTLDNVSLIENLLPGLFNKITGNNVYLDKVMTEFIIPEELFNEKNPSYDKEDQLGCQDCHGIG